MFRTQVSSEQRRLAANEAANTWVSMSTLGLLFCVGLIVTLTINGI